MNPVFREFLSAVRQLAMRLNSHQTALVAAGCAFYSTLALFPAISILVSLYGLLFNPRAAEKQLELLQDLLPPEAARLITHQVHLLVNHHAGTLGLSLAAGLVATFWSAAAATKAMLAALNLAQGRAETRSFLRFQAIGLLLTLATIIAGVVALALLVALPAAIAFVGLSSHAVVLIKAGSIAVLVLFVVALLATLYRLGPSEAPAVLLPGALAGTAVWLAVSSGFTALAETVFRLGATYGPLATAAALMLWFWVSAYATLFGAELNAALSGSGRSAGSRDRRPSGAASGPPGTPSAPLPPPPSSPVPS